jgi:cytochrome bd-type quinol oxidase subunit 2
VAFLIELAFFAAAVIVAWSVYAVTNKAGRTHRRLYFATVVILCLIACWTTFGYESYWNENTRVVGWPVPMVIFQRDDANSPWLDYVGPTTVLALPMNAIIFLFAPSLISLAIAYLRPARSASSL